jgi:hypothetical protein
MHNVNPKEDYSLDEIKNQLDLENDLRQRFRASMPEGDKGKKWLDRRVNQVARYVRKTVNNFQASSLETVDEYRVFHSALHIVSKRTKWKSELSSHPIFAGHNNSSTVSKRSAEISSKQDLQRIRPRYPMMVISRLLS